MRFNADDSKSTSSPTIKTIGREVYFYSDVDDESVLTLLEQLKAVDESSPILALYKEPIWLHIHSYGGEAFAALALADQIKRLKCPTHSVVSGVAASGATLISMACTKRYISSNSFMLIHQLRHAMWGTYEEFKDEMKVMDMLMDKAVVFYAQHSKHTEEEIRKMLERDAWFNAQQALEAGLVDEILE